MTRAPGAVLAVAALAFGCVTHVLASADVAKLRNSIALEAQMVADLADDAGVPKAVLRAEGEALFCSDQGVLEGSGAPRDDAGAHAIPCPRSP